MRRTSAGNIGPPVLQLVDDLRACSEVQLDATSKRARDKYNQHRVEEILLSLEFYRRGFEMPKRHADSESSQHTQPKEDSIVLTDSDNDDPQVISSSDSDDEFVFHPDGSFELRERSAAKKSKLEELELTLQEEIVETSTSPDAQLPPVDPQCARQLLVPFLCSNHGVFYNAVLNRTCLKKNQNKFYKMQLVVDLCNNHHYVLFRWGRVGEKGSIKLIPCEEDILKAQLVFEERFYSKTGNRWEVWAKDSKFEKRKGKYVILKVDYSGPKTQEECIQQLPEEIANNVASSRLKPNLLKLVSLIFDLKAMKETVVRMKFDVTKFPLGMLTKEQILAGYEALDKIEDCIKRKSNKSELVEACSDFYTCIPHSFSRRKRPTLIRTELHVLQAVQTILDLFRKEAGIKNPHPLDSLYETLECELTELDRTNDDYKVFCGEELGTA
ncbi:hypothetical protein MRX96_034416 [Rhipicephalus microplus]